MTKLALRKKGIEQRSQIASKQEKSNIIVEKVKQLIVEKKYQSIGIYMAFEEEVHTRDLVAYCFSNKIAVAAPKIESGAMSFYWINSFEDIKPGHFNVLEPITKMQAIDIEVQIVPMVAFDENCNRIGYGKGYYDRYLKDFHGDVIGIAYEEQKAIKVPTDEFDQKLQRIVTEVKEYHK